MLEMAKLLPAAEFIIAHNEKEAEASQSRLWESDSSKFVMRCGFRALSHTFLREHAMAG